MLIIEAQWELREGSPCHSSTFLILCISKIFHNQKFSPSFGREKFKFSENTDFHRR